MTDRDYKQLNELYSKYRDQGFEILAFPCNQFGGQEPKSNDQIKDFVRNVRESTFPLFAKIDVNGKNASPLYVYLRNAVPYVLVSDIKWNFTKFLVSKDGTPVKRFAPTTAPEDLQADIESLLKQ